MGCRYLMTSDCPDFGTYKPSSFQNWMRRFAATLPSTQSGKRISKLIRRLMGTYSGRPFDITIFGTEKVRLHPYDNGCERHVYAAPQFWDLPERMLLAEAIDQCSSTTFCFADIGANVGLYSFFVRSAARSCGKSLQILAVEPENVVRERFSFNIRASYAENTIQIVPWAVTAEYGDVVLSINENSRGENTIGTLAGTSTTETIPGHPLANILEVAGFDHVDAMKLDIESAEQPVLKAFFRSSNSTLWPTMIILETIHDKTEDSALQCCLDQGYAIKLQTKLNTVLILA